MSIRDLAAHTQLSPYAIRDFEAKGEQANMRTSTQRNLDETLAGAPEHAQQRFAAAVDVAAGTIRERSPVLLVEPLESARQAEVEGDRSGRSAGIGIASVGIDDGLDGDRSKEFAMAAGESARFVRRAGTTDLADQIELFLAYPAIRELAT